MHVYFVTTTSQAERIAVEGFQDADHGPHGRGVMVLLAPVCVKAQGLTVISVLVSDEPLQPFVDGDFACVPASVLNAGHAELIDGAGAAEQARTTRRAVPRARLAPVESWPPFRPWLLNPPDPRWTN